jgi:hypothetical protein
VSSFSTTKAPVDEEIERRINDGEELVDADENLSPLKKVKSNREFFGG